MATDWSEDAKARRSASAKKAAATRAANAAKKSREMAGKLDNFADRLDAHIASQPYPYTQNSRVARWALSGVAAGAMMLTTPKILRG